VGQPSTQPDHGLLQSAKRPPVIVHCRLHSDRQPANSPPSSLATVGQPSTQPDHGLLQSAKRPPVIVRLGLPTYSGAMSARWLVVILTAIAFIAAPLLISARPAARADITAVELAGRIQQSANVAWSGFVETSGTLQVPDNESFATLAQLLGENTQLRVWWRSADDWRVDRIRGTGETDLFRQGRGTVRWVFESQTATYSLVSRIRLPDASDLLPPTFARSMLQGIRGSELSQLPARRIAGIDAAGLRLTPNDNATTVGHVDIWADTASGLPLQVELHSLRDQRPVLTTTFLELNLGAPPAGTTRFTLPEGVRVVYEQSVDVAAAANAFAPYDLPASLAGLGSRNGNDPGAVGIYGRGPTTLIALPLRGRVAGPLRRQLQDRGNAQITEVGTLAPVGPVGVLITPFRGRGGAFLLAGTVTSETLRQAATELLERQ
jgi:outer membrane lipoprotein-sorting protein